MSRIMIVTLAALALGVAGCSNKAEQAEPPAPAPSSAVATPTAASSATPSATPSPTPGAVSATADPATLPKVKVVEVEIEGDQESFTVHGKMVDEQDKPVIGALGDFYVEGQQANLVQSYATDVDGNFKASFGPEVPPTVDLMMHYRGDDNHAPDSFLVRKGIPATPTPVPGQTPGQPTPALPADPGQPQQPAPPVQQPAPQQPTPQQPQPQQPAPQQPAPQQPAPQQPAPQQPAPPNAPNGEQGAPPQN